jgi:DNA-binding Lrp family transcriptional regulator
MDAYVYIRIASGSMAQTLAGLSSKPGIKRVVATIGDWDLLLYAKGESLSEIGNRVLAEVHEIPGVIQTITAPVVPPDRAGLFGIAVAIPQIVPNASYVHIKAKAGKAVEIAEALAGMDEVDGVALLAGDWDILASVMKPWEIASGIILEQVHGIPGVLATKTLVSIEYEEVEEDRDQFSAWS